MVPHNIDAKDQELYSPRTARQGIRTHYYNNETRQELSIQCQEAGDCSGVYELKVTRNREKAVVYSGCTHRQTGRSLYERISEYMLHGSHIRRIIQRALDASFRVYVRWLKIKEVDFSKQDLRKLAEDVENDYLHEYDYPWNERWNVERREIFNIGVQMQNRESHSTQSPRSLREEAADPKSKTVKERPVYWSVWREALVPKEIGAKDPKSYSPRTAHKGIKTHHYNESTRRDLRTQCEEASDCCGVYELKVENGNQTAAVYVGSTCREAKKSLYDRISEYMLDGSHIRKIIQRALDASFRVYVRWLKIKEDDFPGEDLRKLAEDVENEYLDEYNYPWNKRKNVERREIFNIGVQT